MESTFEQRLREALAPLAADDQPATAQSVVVAEMPPLVITQVPRRRPWVATVTRNSLGLIEQVIFNPVDE